MFYVCPDYMRTRRLINFEKMGYAYTVLLQIFISVLWTTQSRVVPANHRSYIVDKSARRLLRNIATICGLAYW